MIDFYTITGRTSTPEAETFRVKLNPECKVYEGHFPEHPVCPGVCSINMIKECAEKAAGEDMVISGIGQCRMTAVLTPEDGQGLEVQIEISKDNYPYTFRSELKNAEKTFMTMKGELSDRVSFL